MSIGTKTDRVESQNNHSLLWIIQNVSLFVLSTAVSLLFKTKKKSTSGPSSSTSDPVLSVEDLDPVHSSHYEETTDESNLQRALRQNKTLNATERVCTVDEKNTPTPHGHLRSEMRLNRMWHRATYIVIRHIDAPSLRSDEGDNHMRDGEMKCEQKEEEKKWNPAWLAENDDWSESYFLVQRRSNIKDYCPGKLDVTPGGVVGFGEDVNVNCQRELMEEMNIHVSWLTSNDIDHRENNRRKNDRQSTIRYLFTFPYQDETVKVWGTMYEVIYRGSLKDLRIQETEVSDILRLSQSEVNRMMTTHPEEWLPDSIHAFQLHLQRVNDECLKRRLLQGYSSGDLTKYTLRPTPKAIFFDCDDCLYFDNWTLANLLTAKIEDWCVRKVGLTKGMAYELYKQYGTALRGLLAEGLLDSSTESIDQFLIEVHDIPVEKLLKRDEALRDMLLKIHPSIPKFIFTASARHHAERCLKALGIDDLFVDIIDVKTCNLATKHSSEAFEAAMRVAKVDDPETCIFLDDSVKNIAEARKIGWRCVLVGKIARDSGRVISSDDAEHEIERIHQMIHVLPELFTDSQ